MRMPPLSDVHHKTLELAQSGHLSVHFSQWGEDVVLWHILRNRKDGFFVDVGAHHPYYLSNTALLTEYNNWSGINVEPDERLIAEFHKHRPQHVNLCCGVGAANGVQRLGQFDDGSINSFDEASVQALLDRGERKFLGWREVRIRTLADILDEHMPPGRTLDVLNVDAEGWDLPVLQSNNWDKYNPELILVEDHSMFLLKAHQNKTVQFLADHGHRLISQTLATSIYRREG